MRLICPCCERKVETAAYCPLCGFRRIRYLSVPEVIIRIISTLLMPPFSLILWYGMAYGIIKTGNRGNSDIIASCICVIIGTLVTVCWIWWLVNDWNESQQHLLSHRDKLKGELK